MNSKWGEMLCNLVHAWHPGGRDFFHQFFGGRESVANALTEVLFSHWRFSPPFSLRSWNFSSYAFSIRLLCDFFLFSPHAARMLTSPSSTPFCRKLSGRKLAGEFSSQYPIKGLLYNWKKKTNTNQGAIVVWQKSLLPRAPKIVPPRKSHFDYERLGVVEGVVQKKIAHTPGGSSGEVTLCCVHVKSVTQRDEFLFNGPKSLLMRPNLIGLTDHPLINARNWALEKYRVRDVCAYPCSLVIVPRKALPTPLVSRNGILCTLVSFFSWLYTSLIFFRLRKRLSYRSSVMKLDVVPLFGLKWPPKWGAGSFYCFRLLARGLSYTRTNSFVPPQQNLMSTN